MTQHLDGWDLEHFPADHDDDGDAWYVWQVAPGAGGRVGPYRTEKDAIEAMTRLSDTSRDPIDFLGEGIHKWQRSEQVEALHAVLTQSSMSSNGVADLVNELATTYDGSRYLPDIGPVLRYLIELERTGQHRVRAMCRIVLAFLPDHEWRQGTLAIRDLTYGYDDVNTRLLRRLVQTVLPSPS